MVRNRCLVPLTILALLCLAIISARAQGPAQEPPVGAQAALGSAFTYQGYLTAGGESASGGYDFWFGLWDGPTLKDNLLDEVEVLGVDVRDGYFAVLLDFGERPFEGEARYLEVAVAPAGKAYTPLEGRHLLTAVPYALYALNVDTATVQARVTGSCPSGSAIRLINENGTVVCEEDGVEYAHVIVVAVSGGDTDSIQDGVDIAASRATPDAPFLVWVAPGTYVEEVTLAPYVHLRGAGIGLTQIESRTGNAAAPYTRATLTLANHSSARDLSLSNIADDAYNIALLAPAGVAAEAAHVAALAEGPGAHNLAAHISGMGTVVALRDVEAIARNGTIDNDALVVETSAYATLLRGSYRGTGGSGARGIQTEDAVIEVTDAYVRARDGGTGGTCGLHNDGSTVTLRGGQIAAFTSTGSAYGIHNISTGGLYTHDELVVSAQGSAQASALRNDAGARAFLAGGSYTGMSTGTNTGDNANGIHNTGAGSTLDARAVVALGSDGRESAGLRNDTDATATLAGGSYTAQGGNKGFGIRNSGSNASLTAERVTVLSRNASTYNTGVENDRGTMALYECAVTGSGGNNARGIENYAGVLVADGASAHGEDAASMNHGLSSTDGASIELSGGAYAGSGGSNARGIYCYEATLVAHSITAIAADATATNAALALQSTTATLSGGSFTARGGDQADAITVCNASSVLSASGVSAFAEGAASTNRGFLVLAGAEVALRGGAFTASGLGSQVYGIAVLGDGTALHAEQVAASAQGQ
ncbi:MAG: hypothetical protein JXA09_14815, partial [Anaerolineae bacterium]|nr:hypothetical protein [Anaerolineae bacterium]